MDIDIEEPHFVQWLLQKTPDLIEIDNEIAKIYEMDVRKYYRVVAQRLKAAIRILSIFGSDYVRIQSNDIPRLAKLLEREENAEAREFLQSLWKSEPTFYDRVFKYHQLLGPTDKTVILITLRQLQLMLDTLKIDINSQSLLPEPAELRERIRNIRELRYQRTDEYVPPPKLELPPRKPLGGCNEPERQRRDELNRQRALQIWADQKYLRMLRFMREDPWMVTNYKAKVDAFVKANPFYNRGIEHASNKLFKEWKVRMELDPEKSDDPLRNMGEEISDILKTNKPRDTWSIVYRQLVYFQARELLDEATVIGLYNLNPSTIEKVFGSFALEIYNDDMMKSCLKEWAQNYKRDVLFVMDQKRSIRYQYSVLRLQSFQRLVQDAIRARIRQVEDYNELSDLEKYFLRPQDKDILLERAIIKNIRSCLNCGNDAPLQCGGCAETMAYCGISCQEKDWARGHEDVCEKLHLK